jgi:hypothetical protein
MVATRIQAPIDNIVTFESVMALSFPCTSRITTVIFRLAASLFYNRRYEPRGNLRLNFSVGRFNGCRELFGASIGVIFLQSQLPLQ